MAYKKTPPKLSIANGFVGSFPQEIKLFNKEGQRVTRKVEDDELTDTLKAMLAPLRPYDCVFAYSGGAQKSLRGNYQFFEMDQNRLGGVMNHLNQAGIGEDICCSQYAHNFVMRTGTPHMRNFCPPSPYAYEESSYAYGDQILVCQQSFCQSRVEAKFCARTAHTHIKNHHCITLF